MRLLRACGVAAIVAGPAIAASSASPELRLVDDRGERISQPLSARLLGESGEPKHSVELKAGALLPEDWTGTVEIDGDDHGPVTVPAERLRMLAEPLVVPRKATLSIDAGEAFPFVLTYSVVSDGVLRERTKAEMKSRGQLRVPSGSGLLSASRRGSGLYHRLLHLAPGATVKVTPTFSANAVVLLRILKLSDGSPVPRAAVTETSEALETAAGRPGRRLCLSDEAGLCLVSLGAKHLTADVEADGLVPLRSSFALESGVPRLIETVRLSSGCRPLFRVAVDGETGRGLPLTLRVWGASGERPISAEGSGTRSGASDDEGEWRPGTVPPGSWVVRVQAEKGQPVFEKTVELLPETEPVIDLALERIRVTGAVTRGGKGVASQAVVVGSRDLGEQRVSADGYAKEQEIVTDSDGEFEVFLWREGLYTFAAEPLVRKTFPISKTGARVLLRLAGDDLVCVVVDPEGQPVGDATVTITESESGQAWTGTRKTSADGRVSYPVRTGTEVTAHADARGYRRSEKAMLRVPEEGPPGPLTLRLAKDEELQGRFVGPMGMPVAGALLMGIRPNGAAVRTSVTTDVDGRFGVSRTGESSARLYFVSPKVPLTVHDVYDVGQKEEIVFPPAEVGVLDIQLASRSGTPVASKSAVLEFRGAVIPLAVLAQHLAWRGLGTASDARGTILVPDLPTGDFTVILADVAAPTGGGPLRANVYVAPGRNTVRIVLAEEPRD